MGTDDLIEKVFATYRAVMRKIAQGCELKVIHLEIMLYLDRSNNYSNTSLAISEYLGLTKGSLSQSLTFLESEGFLTRDQDTTDRRVFHIQLSERGKEIVKKLNAQFQSPTTTKVDNPKLETWITQLQRQNGLRQFGICRYCKHNQGSNSTGFICGLTGDSLSIADTLKLCREYASK